MIRADLSSRHTGTPLGVPLARQAVSRFIAWLERFGEQSQDSYDFWACGYGRWAKGLYYRTGRVGLPAVVPCVALDFVVPSARRFVRAPQRFPIADAHYAMAFLNLAGEGGATLRDRGLHYLEVLEQTRCPEFAEFCWGYPFDWVTCFGTWPSGTPLITTTPYVYEAFETALELTGNEHFGAVLESIGRFAHAGLRDAVVAPGVNACSYTPRDQRRVVNANAYRAFLLTSAGLRFGRADWLETARANLAFVLQCQADDGSWDYAFDGRDAFVDNFHTCFVLKNLTKIWRRTAAPEVLAAIRRGFAFYKAHLLDADGRPRPFARAQRLNLIEGELYDYAEGINLAILLRGVDPDAERILERLVAIVCTDWLLPDGHFVTRRTRFGVNRIPYHRWAQSQVFRALSVYLGAVDPAVGDQERSLQ